MPKKFTKKTESFVCEQCGAEVVGTGYTNHCPQCLWSKHVDVNPGDRLENCGGMMKPVDVELEKQEWVLIHECRKCRTRKRNILSEIDNFDVVVALKQKVNEQKVRKA